jgi:hypothetical protein
MKPHSFTGKVAGSEEDPEWRRSAIMVDGGTVKNEPLTEVLVVALLFCCGLSFVIGVIIGWTVLP